MLSAFTFDIKEKPGPTNIVDPLSRQPVGDAPANEAVLIMVTSWSGGSVITHINHAYATYPWVSEEG